MSVPTKSPASILAQLLIDLSLGIAPSANGDWRSYANDMPDLLTGPDSVLCSYDTTAIFDGRLMRGGDTIEHPGWQIRVRAMSFESGWAKAAAIANALDGVARRTVTVDATDFVIQGIHRRGNIIPLGHEDNDRKRRQAFTLNGVMTIL